jgi:two-component system, response regulator PdtaR
LTRADAADMIRDLGFGVIEALDADQALSFLEHRGDVSIVFTDIQMPGSMDGLRLISVVRERWPPVALLIASGQETPLAKDMPFGARFLPKPYAIEQLRTHLHALMRGRNT